MDRMQGSLLAQPGQLQANITIGEFLDKIEPNIGVDSARRLRLLLEDNLHDPMPL